MLPPGVQLLVRSRRRVLAGRARGRVLDLGGAESHASLWANHEPRSPEDRTAVRLGATFEQELAGLVETDEQFDTVFSAFRLVAVADLDAACNFSNGFFSKPEEVFIRSWKSRTLRCFSIVLLCL